MKLLAAIVLLAVSVVGQTGFYAEIYPSDSTCAGTQTGLLASRKAGPFSVPTGGCLEFYSAAVATSSLAASVVQQCSFTIDSTNVGTDLTGSKYPGSLSCAGTATGFTKPSGTCMLDPCNDSGNTVYVKFFTGNVVSKVTGISFVVATQQISFTAPTSLQGGTITGYQVLVVPTGQASDTALAKNKDEADSSLSGTGTTQTLTLPTTFRSSPSIQVAVRALVTPAGGSPASTPTKGLYSDPQAITVGCAANSYQQDASTCVACPSGTGQSNNFNTGGSSTCIAVSPSVTPTASASPAAVAAASSSSTPTPQAVAIGVGVGVGVGVPVLIGAAVLAYFCLRKPRAPKAATPGASTGPSTTSAKVPQSPRSTYSGYSDDSGYGDDEGEDEDECYDYE